MDRIYQAYDLATCIAASEADLRPCMALWGPSQSGKSTLISSYVDAGADKLGNGSSLHWPEGLPARFVAQDPQAGAIVLNPVHLGVDASGCVSRFQLRETVADPMFPVGINLAKPIQIMHALALGYLSECLVQNSQGHTTSFTPEIFRARMEMLAPMQGKSAAPKREVFEELGNFSLLLEMLIDSELPRYENLRTEWRALRRELLSNKALLSGSQQIKTFAHDILWDGNSELTALMDKFEDFRGKLINRWGSRPIRCSLKVAAALLDIQGCKQIHDAAISAASASDRKFAKSACAISFDVSADFVRVGENLSNPLVKGIEDFGLLQGLICVVFGRGTPRFLPICCRVERVLSGGGNLTLLYPSIGDKSGK